MPVYPGAYNEPNFREIPGRPLERSRLKPPRKLCRNEPNFGGQFRVLHLGFLGRSGLLFLLYRKSDPPDLHFSDDFRSGVFLCFLLLASYFQFFRIV